MNLEFIDRVVDNFGLPVLATLVAGLIGSLVRLGWQRVRRRSGRRDVGAETQVRAAAEFDAAAARAAASLRRLADMRRTPGLSAVRRGRQLASDVEARAAEVGNSYSTLRTSADLALIGPADALMSALGALGDVAAGARRHPFASSSEWERAWEDFQGAQESLRDATRDAAGVEPYRRTVDQ